MTQVWAHRGASGDAPENTMAAFELALEQGCDGIELDVQLTRDGQVVVIHDETLDRTTNGHGWVAEHGLAELAALDASAGWDGYAGSRIPTLDQVFTLVKGTDCWVNIELKNSLIAYRGLADRVVALIAEHGVADRVVLSSFNHESLRRLVRSETGLSLGALYSDQLWRPWAYAARLGVDALHPALSATRRRIVEKSHAHGLAVRVWTVNEPAEVQLLADLGVDAVITNYPDRARAAIG